MSTRERWTVYPILFLTLGIALKDKLNRTITTDTLVCESVLVVDRDQTPMAELFSTPGGGVLKTLARNQDLTVSLGSYPKASGLFAVDNKGNVLPGSVILRRSRDVPVRVKQAPAKDGPEPREKADTASDTPEER